jgi:hypothetical protein
VLESQNTLLVLRKSSFGSLAMLFHFGEQTAEIARQLPSGDWQIIFDSAAFSPSSSPPKTTVSATITLKPRSFVVLENISPKSEQ